MKKEYAPRYKVKALFPGSQNKIGDIVIDVQGVFHKYPKLYKRVTEWWDLYAISNLPRYVKKVTEGGYYLNGDVLEVFAWRAETTVMGKHPRHVMYTAIFGKGDEYPISCFVPALSHEIAFYEKKGSVFNVSDMSVKAKTSPAIVSDEKK